MEDNSNNNSSNSNNNIIVEGFWDCTSCGTKEISGLTDTCPNCGTVRGKDVKFYITNNSRELTQEEVEKLSKEPDWVCPYCHNLNSGLSTKCKGCGGSKNESTQDYFSAKEDREHDSEQNCKPISQSQSSTHQDQNSARQKRGLTIPFSGILGGICSLVAVIVATLGIINYLKPDEAVMQIKGVSWKRTIPIEVQKTFTEDGWSRPDGARLITVNNEIKCYNQEVDYVEKKVHKVPKQVQTGTEQKPTGKMIDNGNGTFTKEMKTVPVYETVMVDEEYEVKHYKDVPVYAPKYYYEIDRWVHSRDVVSSGVDKNPVWGEVVLGEKEREGKESARTEEYFVLAQEETKKGELKTDTYTMNYEDWLKVETGSEVTVLKLLGKRLELKEQPQDNTNTSSVAKNEASDKDALPKAS